MTTVSHSPKIFLSAGEASGEQYGALLMTEIRRLAPEAEFFGLGGTRMAAAGLRRSPVAAFLACRADDGTDVAGLKIQCRQPESPRALLDLRKDGGGAVRLTPAQVASFSPTPCRSAVRRSLV